MVVSAHAQLLSSTSVLSPRGATCFKRELLGRGNCCSNVILIILVKSTPHFLGGLSILCDIVWLIFSIELGEVGYTPSCNNACTLSNQAMTKYYIPTYSGWIQSIPGSCCEIAAAATYVSAASIYCSLTRAELSDIYYK